LVSQVNSYPRNPRWARVSEASETNFDARSDGLPGPSDSGGLAQEIYFRRGSRISGFYCTANK
jgi:hypothetical protein